MNFTLLNSKDFISALLVAFSNNKIKEIKEDFEDAVIHNAIKLLPSGPTQVHYHMLITSSIEVDDFVYQVHPISIWLENGMQMADFSGAPIIMTNTLEEALDYFK